MSPFELGCAILSSVAYAEGRNPNNRLSPQTGVTPLPGALGYENHPDSGFEASAFEFGGKIVIAFAGTGPQVGDLIADVSLGSGVIEQQMKQAAVFYKNVQSQAAGKEIVFTGHSLGGGLAALMGVFFDRAAVVFDPAPFRLSATQANAQVVRNHLQSRGLSTDGLDTFTTTEEALATAKPALFAALSAVAVGAAALPLLGLPLSSRAAAFALTRRYPISIRGENRIQAHAVDGEFLTDGYFGTGRELLNDLRIRAGGQPNLIGVNASFEQLGLKAGVELHSINLLIALAKDERLVRFANDYKDLLPALFDDALYQRPVKESDVDFLVRLVQREYAGAASADGTGFISRFAEDLATLSGDTGLAQTLGRAGLIAAAVEHYYFRDPKENAPFFSVAGGAIHFDLSSIVGDEKLSSLVQSRAIPRLEQAFSHLLAPDEQDYVRYLGGKTHWHVQQGAAAMNFTASGQNNDVAIGGTGVDVINTGDGNDTLVGSVGSDVLDGGSGRDVLLGGADADFLTGGTGDDQLIGGSGDDTYYFNAGFGNDVIVDSDANGRIRYAGQALPEGRKVSNNAWASSDGQWKYFFAQGANTSTEGTLIIQRANSADTITIKNFQQGRFGISLVDGNPAETNRPQVTSYIHAFGIVTPLSRTYNRSAPTDLADHFGIIEDQVTYSFGAGDDYIWERNGEDYITQLRNGGFTLSRPAWTGDSIIDGGAGNDVIYAGAGRDRVFGGAGNDFIFAAFASPTPTTGAWANGLQRVGGVNGSRGPFSASLSTAILAQGVWRTWWGDVPIYDSQGNLLTPTDSEGWLTPGTTWTLRAEPNGKQWLPTDFALEIRPDDGNYIAGGSGNDYIVGGLATDVLDGGEDADIIWGLDGQDQIIGGDGDDQLMGGGQFAGDIDGDVLDGGAGADTLYGGGGGDSLFGGSGDDFLAGDGAYEGFSAPDAEQGNDLLDGGAGDDTLVGGLGDDSLYGGEGSDLLIGDLSANVALHGDDYLDGEAGDDELQGGGGDDTLFGGAGNDHLFGDVDSTLNNLAGDDYLDGEEGDDILEGGGGDDVLIGGVGDDTLRGDGDFVLNGDDELDGGDGKDVIYGDGGNDILDGGADDDVLVGGTGDDQLSGDEGQDRLFGGDGTDSLLGGAGNDELSGDAGNDDLRGGAGADFIAGGLGDDQLDGEEGNDVLVGGDGADAVFGGAGDDSLSGQAGDDFLGGGNGADVLDGGQGSDDLRGDDGDDRLSGGGNDDTLAGGAGQDYLDGGSGNDRLIGGEGDDTYVSTGGDDFLIDSSGNDSYLISGGRVTIEEFGGVDTVTISNASAFSVTVRAESADLVIEGGVTGPTVRIKGVIDSTGGFIAERSIENVRFSDGSVLSADDLRSWLDRGGIVRRGSSGNDVIVGSSGSDLIEGLAGDDVIDGGAGADHMRGGTGNDTFIVGSPADLVSELPGEGSDIVRSTVSYTLPDNVENLVLSGDAAISGAGNALSNSIAGNAAANTISGGDGDDYLDGRSGDDSLSGGSGADFLLGDEGRDTLDGGDGNDRLRGGSGDDLYVFRRGSGSDSIQEVDDYGGGSGDELLLEGLLESDVEYERVPGSITDLRIRVRGTDDSVTIAGCFGAWGGRPNSVETVVFGDGTRRNVSDLDRLVGALLTGSDNGEELVGSPGPDRVFGEAGNDSLIGLWGADYISGGAGADNISGDSDNDQLRGDGGDDYLEGGKGNDVIWGDHGPDEGSLGDYGDDRLSGDDGDDTLYGEGGDDDLFGGSGDDVLIGDASSSGASQGDDFLMGQDGDDRLDGGGRDDQLWGGSGDDILLGDGGSALQGRDWLEGEDGNDTLIGGGGDDRLNGGSGNDALHGGDGQDSLGGGDGNDLLYCESGFGWAWGGGGNDLLVGGDDGNQLFGGSGADELVGGAGGDGLQGGSGDDVLAGGRHLSGAYFVDRFWGGTGNDRLVSTGLGAIFHYRRGDGNDVIDNTARIGNALGTLDLRSYRVFDESTDWEWATVPDGLGPADKRISATDVTFARGTGEFSGDLVITVVSSGETIRVKDQFLRTDGLRRSGISAIEFDGGVLWSRDDIEYNTVDAGGVATDGDDVLLGFARSDQISGRGGNDSIFGDEGDDILNGDSGNDRLFGDGGNDRLDGGVGQDVMAGGAGDDAYVVDDVADVVTELPNGGLDGVEASVSYTLGESVETLTLTGSAAINGSGNALDNTITGNAAANRLDGGMGSDLLVGGAGDDVYVVDNENDDTVENVNEGIDTVYTSITFDLSENIENLTATGSAELTLRGNSAANIITGNSATNWIVGGAGDDRMIGGGGDDRYYVDSVGDVVVEEAGGGSDAIWSSVSYSLGAEVEALYLTGSVAVRAAGNDRDNWLGGNDAANVLEGFGGDDWLSGGLGNDTIYGGAGRDFLYGDGGDDVLDGGTAGLWTDVLVGGLGNDRLVSDGSGAVFRYGRGDGNDVIENRAATGVAAGVLSLSNSGINAGGVSLARGVSAEANDLILTIVETGEKIRVKDHFLRVAGARVAGLSSVVFSDGMSWSRADIDSRTPFGAGVPTEGNDVLVGSGGDDVLSGLGGDDIIYGDAGNDTLGGDAGNDQLFGEAGNDRLNGGLGADTLIGGAGDDIYVVDSAGDSVTEAAGGGTDLVESSVTYTLSAEVENLTLTGAAAINGTGNASANRITGNAVANRLDGGAGADTMIGGAGDDVYVVESTGDVVTEVAGGGVDLVESSITYTLGAEVENLTLTGTAAINGTGNALANRIAGNASANRIDGGAGGDTMAGGAGNDTYVVDNVADVVIEDVGGGIDLVEASVSHTLSAEVENLALTGTAAINGTGNASANRITGNAAANRIDGGAGNDTLIGGAGNDTYVVDSAGDVITEVAAGGTDLVEASTSYTLSAEVENLTLTGTSAINGTGNVLANRLTGNTGNNRLDGGAGADTMIGGAGDDTYVVESAGDVVTEVAGGGIDLVESSITYTLGTEVENLTLTGTAVINGTGNAANNRITGNAASNRINGGAGDDTMIGGAGDDTYVVDSAGDVITEAAAGGTDLVEASASYVLAAQVENLTLTGTAAINGTGNTLANTLVGNSAANTLDGGAGADVMRGGAGNDTYVVDNVGDSVVESAGQGVDLVQSSITYTLVAEVENLTLTGTAAINGTGNALANTLVGNSAANTLDGGVGADVMRGGVGNDVYVVDNVGDAVVEAAGEGVDLVQSSITYALGAEVENLTLSGTAAINGTGNALTNRITGNAAANRIDGGAGADTMIGGAGDDVYVVDAAGDLVTEAAGGGTDSVEASVTYTLSAEVENLTLTGAAVINGTGNALANRLTGNTGNNRLDGGAGADTMIGGAGDDVYVVENTGDVVTELAGGGVDLVESSITYTLGAEVENLTLTGAAAVNGTGNALANRITGNAAANRIDGGAGNDTMIGGAGNDTYVVDSAADVVIEYVGGGIDLVEASVSHTLSAEVENLTLTGTAAVNGTGNALANRITGNAAANRIDGGTGNDTMIGGAGNDTYVVDSAGDVVTESAGGGTDLVEASVSYTLSAEVENLTLTGTAAINGTGNTLANRILGNAAANRIDGGAGNDTMVGGAGNDTYVVDSAGDVVTEVAGSGVDLVESSITYTLGAEVENLTLTGVAVINGTGNAANNRITGNAASNRINGGAGDDTMIGGAGDDVYVVDSAGDVVTEVAAGGVDLVEASVTCTLGAEVENLILTGTAAINGSGNALANRITGNAAANRIDGGAGADTMIGGAGDDVYVIENIGDVVTEVAGGGVDLIESSITYTLGAEVENLRLTGAAAINGTGNALANLLSGNSANNVLDGGAGNDVLQGAAGNDTLTDSAGRGLLDGGDGVDVMTGGTDRQFFAGGAGSDTHTLGGGADIIAFNRGHGADTVTAPAAGSGQGESNDTLSLGGIRYSELRLARSGNDLLVKVAGTTDSIRFSGWYAAAGNRTISTLQMIVDSSADYSAASTDALLNRRVVRLNFSAIASAFDAAYAANPAVGDWAIPTATLTAARTAGSDTDAIGGQLAYRYARDGNFAGLDLAAAQAVMADTNFATAAQSIGTGATTGGVRLMKTRADMAQDTIQPQTSSTSLWSKGPLGVRSLSLRAVLEAQRQSLLAPEPELVALPSDEGETGTVAFAALEDATPLWLGHRDAPFIGDGIATQRSRLAVSSAPVTGFLANQALPAVEVCEMPAESEEATVLSAQTLSPVSNRLRETFLLEEPYGKEPAEDAEGAADPALAVKRPGLLSQRGGLFSGPLRYIKLADAIAATGVTSVASSNAIDTTSPAQTEQNDLALADGAARRWWGQRDLAWIGSEAGDPPNFDAWQFAPVTEQQASDQSTPELVTCDLPGESAALRSNPAGDAPEDQAAVSVQRLVSQRAGSSVREVFQLEQPFGKEPAEVVADLGGLSQQDDAQGVQTSRFTWGGRTRYGYIKLADMLTAAAQPAEASQFASTEATDSAPVEVDGPGTSLVEMSAVRRWMLTDPSLTLVDRWAQMEAELGLHAREHSDGLLGGEATYVTAQVASAPMASAPDERLIGIRRPRGEMVR